MDDTIRRAGANPSEMEYLSLRDEVMKRVESRQQLLSIALTLAGAFLGIGWGTGGAVALLLFPPLVTLLAVGWVQNEVRIGQINRYIREVLTTQIPTLGFERFIRGTGSAFTLDGTADRGHLDRGYSAADSDPGDPARSVPL